MQKELAQYFSEKREIYRNKKMVTVENFLIPNFTVTNVRLRTLKIGGLSKYPEDKKDIEVHLLFFDLHLFFSRKIYVGIWCNKKVWDMK